MELRYTGLIRLQLSGNQDLMQELIQTYASGPGGRYLSNKQMHEWTNRQVIE